MSAVADRLSEFIARALEPDERAAVLGDMAESGESGIRSVVELLGLIARRQALLWYHWRPWLAVVGLAGMVAPCLLRFSYGATFPLHMDLQTYWKNAALYESGLTRQEEIILVLCQGLGLLLWSWISGIVLGTLARKTIWVIGLLFFIPFILPLAFGVVFVWRQGQALDLVLLVLQWVLSMLLTVVPCLSGLRKSLREWKLSPWEVGLLAIACLGITTLAMWMGGWPEAAVARWAGNAWDPARGWQARILPFVVLNWPVVYLLVQTAKTKRVVPAV